MRFDPKAAAFDREARAELTKLLPRGASVARALADLTEIARRHHHPPARKPSAYWDPWVAVNMLIPFLVMAAKDPAFARRAGLLRRTCNDLVQVRDLIEWAKQGEKQRKEAFYAAILRVWTREGGELTAGDEETGSACVLYLIKVVEAVTGKTLSISGGRKIVQRQPSRRPPARKKREPRRPLSRKT